MRVNYADMIRDFITIESGRHHTSLSLDDLPEELLSQIIAHVGTSDDPLLTPPDSKTLYSLCRTSWKFYRIAKPHLYAHVHSHSGVMGRQFFDTISKQPALAERVKHFAVQHTAEGCYRPVESSFYQEEYGTVADTCGALLLETLRELRWLEVLDLSRFAVRANARSEWLDAVTKLMGKQHSPLSDRPPLFSNLRHLSVHPSATAVQELLPFFGLPKLRSLEVDIRKNGTGTRLPIANTDKSYPITSLSIIGFKGSKLAQVSWLAARCSALHTLLITTHISDSMHIGRLFGHHIRSGSLKTIRVAIQGLWHYEVEMQETQASDASLGGEIYNTLVYATSAADVVEGRVEMSSECQSVRSVTIRELTEAEKKAYDMRRQRRP
jgi:hypothetical protein